MNQNLANELVTMMREDQRLLQQLLDSEELPSESYHPQMKALHEYNASRLKEIIGAHGWPGISLVGEEVAKAAWLVVQHSVSDPEFMGERVSLLKDAVAREDVAGWQLAFLQDRICTLSGKPVPQPLRLLGDDRSLADAYFSGVARWAEYHPVIDFQAYPRGEHLYKKLLTDPAVKFAQAVE